MSNNKLQYPMPSIAALKRYVDNADSICPLCEDTDPQVVDRMSEFPYYYCYMHCNQCDSQWTEEYKLSRIIQVEPGERENKNEVIKERAVSR